MLGKTQYGFWWLLAALALGCGGAQAQVGETPVGESSGSGSESVSDDLDVADGASTGDKAGSQDEKTDGAGTAKANSAPAVTFTLKNTHDEDLVLSLDKGWQPVIFAYSGKPPNAKSILMFPTHCTAACSAGDGERCPVCKAPEKVKDIKAAEKREVIAPGASLNVPWDGKTYVYEDTSADGRDCKCFRRGEVPPETYTIKSCGLRITKSAKKSSRFQCVEAQAVFPGDGPQVVELEFGKP